MIKNSAVQLVFLVKISQHGVVLQVDVCIAMEVQVQARYVTKGPVSRPDGAMEGMVGTAGLLVTLGSFRKVPVRIQSRAVEVAGGDLIGLDDRYGLLHWVGGWLYHLD